MFSRKGFIRMIASVLIILMCMVMVPLTTGDKVRADGPDTKQYIITYPYDRKTIYKGKDSATFLFSTESAMTYRFYMDESSREYGYGDSATIAVYDTNSKLIKSSNEPDLTVELKGDAQYYVVVTGAKPGAEIFFEYNFRLKAENKGPRDDKFITMPRSAYFWSSTYKGSWDSYSVLEGSDVKLSLDVGELPNGIKLKYSWYRENDDSNEFKEKLKENEPLSLKVAEDTDDYYLCRVKSTDGSINTQFIFHMSSYDLLEFKSGKSIEYKIQAFKPGEERKFTIPDFIYDGDKGELSYYLSESRSNPKHISSSTAPTSVPSDWKSSSFYCGISGKNRAWTIYFYGLSFVFADGDGITAKAGETYHLDKTSYKDGYEQAILSFTPDKSGNYDLALSDFGEYFMPAIVVFDSDRNVVAENYGSFMSEDSIHDIADKYSLRADLTAGKTYYIAVPNSSGEFDCNLSISSVKTSGHSFEDFVERLYVVALGRDSEPDGKAHWCKVVGNGSYSGADCARFFLTSPEFNGRNLNDEEYLKVLYKTFFDRDASADPDGFNFWLGKIGEWGRARVLEGFIDSTEWCNICADYGVRSGAMTAKATRASANATAFATRLYTECLGREPEEGGLNYWSLSLTNQERTGTQAAKEFFYSPEFKDKNLGDEEYVNRLYKTFMGRDPEAEGKAYWLEQLGNGSMNRDQVFDFFSTCEEFTGICNSYAIAR